MNLFSKILLPVFVLLFVTCSSHKGPEEIYEEIDPQKITSAMAFCKKNNFDTSVCFFVDMSIHSGRNRFFVFDMKQKKVIHSGLCCHGMGEGSTPSTPVFSNVSGSNCTSLGKYKIGIRSYSNYGIHVHYKLHGLESTNNNAFNRIVVLHSYHPVENTEIYPQHLPMGYSLGCPVVSNEFMTTLDSILKKKEKPVLLWIYK